MTRCHFAFIAFVIASVQHDREAVAEAFAANLARTNPRFNRERFLAACGVEPRA